MPAQPLSRDSFLQDPAPAKLEEAAAWNHRELFILNARAAGGEVWEREGVVCTFTRAGGRSMVPFPRLPADRAGEVLDAVNGFYLDRRPEDLVGCWSLDPAQPPDLGVLLLARGFQPGWRPSWMCLDLERMTPDHPRPKGLSIEEDAPESEDPAGLPYSGRGNATHRREAERLQPGRLHCFAARLRGRVVGRSSVYLTTGPLGAAGIYDVGVVPEHRNRGIGKAVTAAACLRARDLECRFALLNGTGRRMYEQLGFRHFGYGSTWWLNVPRLAARPPSPEEVELAEAVGRGDLAALRSIGSRGIARDLDAPLTNDMTLLQLAVELRQPGSAEWLVDQGASLDLLSAWSLGWKDRAADLLRAHPERAKQRFGEMRLTPLHEAAQRGDLELAQLILTANPDLDAVDATYHATPLGWARHFGRAELIELLEGHRKAAS